MVTLGEQQGEVAQLVAQALVRQRRVTGKNLRDLVASTGWSLQTVRRYLGGERVMPVDAFYRLSTALGLDPAAVLAEVQELLGEARRDPKVDALPPAQAGHRVVFETRDVRVIVEPLGS